LRRKRDLSGTTPAVARGGGATDAAGRRRLELWREQVLAQEKAKGRRGMDATTNCESPNSFYRVEEGGETMSWRRNANDEWSSSMLSFREERKG
jgi:hypothetical protein